MTIQEFLDWLDGRGIVFEDEDLVAEELSDWGIGLIDYITITSPGGVVLLQRSKNE